MHNLLPYWVTNYQKKDLPGDLIAGLTVAIVLIPQGMAYALLADMPPQLGLYAGSVGAVIYALFGSSPMVAAGPTATLSILTAASVSQIASNLDPTLIAATLALLVGFILLVAGLLRIGTLLNFVNPNIISAFATAAALTIAFSQLHHLMGIPGPDGTKPYEMLIHAINHLDETQATTLVLGVFGIIGLLIFRNYVRSWLISLNVNRKLATLIARSGPLFVTIIGTLLVMGLNLHEEANVAIIGDIPSGLPAFQTPAIDFAVFEQLLIGALTICLIAFLENIAILERLEEKAQPNRELIALGFANIGVAFLSGFPVNGSFSRSAVNKMSKARTGLTSFFSTAIVFVVLIFFTPYLYFFPRALLAAIVFVAISNLINWAAPFKLWRTSRRNTVLWITTFIGTLMVGLAPGVAAGVVVSIILITIRRLGIRWPRGEWPRYERPTIST